MTRGTKAKTPRLFRGSGEHVAYVEDPPHPSPPWVGVTVLIVRNDRFEHWLGDSMVLNVGILRPVVEL